MAQRYRRRRSIGNHEAALEITNLVNALVIDACETFPRCAVDFCFVSRLYRVCREIGRSGRLRRKMRSTPGSLQGLSVRNSQTRTAPSRRLDAAANTRHLNASTRRGISSGLPAAPPRHRILDRMPSTVSERYAALAERGRDRARSRAGGGCREADAAGRAARAASALAQVLAARLAVRARASRQGRSGVSTSMATSAAARPC